MIISVATERTSCTHYACLIRERIWIELLSGRASLNIMVRSELHGKDLSSLSWLVFAAVDTLIKDWYNLNVSFNSLSLLVCCSTIITFHTRFFFSLHEIGNYFGALYTLLISKPPIGLPIFFRNMPTGSCHSKHLLSLLP